MKILFCGDPHGRFDHIAPGALESQADVVVLLGDMEPERPLEVELKPLLDLELQTLWIPGNHDTDSERAWMHTWGSQLEHLNLHGRVVELADGTRIGGLGGVFRESVWHPDPASARGGEPAYRTRDAHTKATPRQDRWAGGVHRRHWSSIYPVEVDRLGDLRADVLVLHEAPGYHPNGFPLLDDLARSMGAQLVVHGHQHDNLDSSAQWPGQGFRSHGVGLRGLSAWDTSTMAWTVVRPGELDEARSHRLKGHE